MSEPFRGQTTLAQKLTLPRAHPGFHHQPLEKGSNKLSCLAHHEPGNHEGTHPNYIPVSSQANPHPGSFRGPALALTQPNAYLTVDVNSLFLLPLSHFHISCQTWLKPKTQTKPKTPVSNRQIKLLPTAHQEKNQQIPTQLQK